MSTKKLQIVTPIVTSVNGKTGDVTLDISGGGGTSTPMKKLTFTGGATGEYDGSSDVSVAIPGDRFYVMQGGEDADNDFIFTNDFDEAKAAYESGKIFVLQADDGSVTTLTVTNFTDTVMYSFADYGELFYFYAWIKDTKKIEANVGTTPIFDYITSTTSGAVYWDSDKKEWTIKEDKIYELNFGKDADGDTTITNDFDEVVAAIQTGKCIIGQFPSIDNANKTSILAQLNMDGENNILSIYFIISGGDILFGVDWLKSTKKLTNVDQYYTPILSPNSLQESGAVYWDKDQGAYILKDISYKAGNGISISYDGTISVTAAKMYSGTNTPADSLGENGDIYIQTEG